MLRIPSDLAAFIYIRSAGDDSLWVDSETRRIRQWCADCDCFGMIRNGELVGMTMFEADGTLHFARIVEDQMKPASTKDFVKWVEILSWGIGRFGRIKTAIRHSNVKTIKLAQKAGFKQSGEDAKRKYFDLDLENYRFMGLVL